MDEIKKLVTKTAPIKALAKAMAADAAMGMSDRVLILFNAQNFLFDPKSKRFNFVDNTSSDAAGSLTSKITAAGLENARSSFDAWTRMAFVKKLATARTPSRRSSPRTTRGWTTRASRRPTARGSSPRSCR